jgi:hypothetical protein
MFTRMLSLIHNNTFTPDTTLNPKAAGGQFYADVKAENLASVRPLAHGEEKFVMLQHELDNFEAVHDPRRLLLQLHITH